jgi:glycosyltransferase involved in cell wall biosynthesis
MKIDNLKIKNKIIRITTVPLSLKTLLKGQLKFMSKYFEIIAVSSPGEDLQLVKEHEGVEVFPLSLTRKITPFKDLFSLFKLYCFLIKERPLIVHTHTPKAGIIGMLASKLANVPIRLHTVAGLPLMEAHGNKRKVLNFVEKITYQCATRVYPNSKGLEEFIISNNFVNKNKIKVIGNGSSNGINTSYFSALELNKGELENLKESLNLKDDDFIFVFVGRLVGDKGINELIKAFSELHTANPSKRIKLLLVGSQEAELDPLKEETLEIINTNPNIISVGFQKDVRPYYAISSALVFPSYREGFPNVVMQAGSMDLPSIVSDINGCNEIIIEGENGIIVPTKDYKSLYHSMYKLVADSEYYSILRKNSRRLIVERYEQKVIWGKILSEYQSIIRASQ